jgi:hypothetical protein
MSKLPSLSANLSKISVTPDTTPPRARDIETQARGPATTRAGKKKVTAPLDPAEHKRLKALAVERETTTEALLTEAIRDLFAKYA